MDNLVQHFKKCRTGVHVIIVMNGCTWFSTIWVQGTWHFYEMLTESQFLYTDEWHLSSILALDDMRVSKPFLILLCEWWRCFRNVCTLNKLSKLLQIQIENVDQKHCPWLLLLLYVRLLSLSTTFMVGKESSEIMPGWRNIVLEE